MGRLGLALSLTLPLATLGWAQEGTPVGKGDQTAESVSKDAPAAVAPEATPTPGAAPSPTPTPGASPSPAASPAPSTSPTPAPAPTPTPDEVACPPGAACTSLSAETFGSEKGHTWGRGFADLQAGDMRIQADSMDIYTTETEKGTRQTLKANGNVVILRRNERMSGSSLDMDLETGRGTLNDFVGYLEPGIFIQARKVERLDSRTMKIESGSFTSCCQPNPRWGFSAYRAKLKLNDKIIAQHVRFNVAIPVWPNKLPALYFPFLIYPIQDDQRSTGFLFPSFNIDFKRGVDVRSGFFWAMGRSADQTFSAEYRPGLSPRLGHEFRYALGAPSFGTFTSYFFPPQSESVERGEGLPAPNINWEYDLKWNAIQILPGRFTLKLQVDQSSPQNVNDSLSRVLGRYRQSIVSLQRSFGFHSFSAFARTRDTYLSSGSTSVQRYLPQIRLSLPQRRLQGSGLVYEYSAQFDGLQSGVTDTEGASTLQYWSRFDVTPALSRPFVLPFLTLTPRVQVRYTRYGSAYLADFPTLEPRYDLGPDGPPITRRYVEGRMELLGPSVSRIFNNPTHIYSDRFKHLISPEVIWTYRASTENNAFIPKFDALDNFPPTNELRYGLTQRFYAKRKGRDGKLNTYEFLSWRVFQTYYFSVPQTASDANFSSALISPSGEPVHQSAIRSQFRFRPLSEFSIDWTQEYDPNFKTWGRHDLSAGIRIGRSSLGGTWSRSKRYKVKTDTLVTDEDTVGGNTGLNLANGRLGVGATSTYSITRKQFLEQSANLRLNVQCFGLMLQLSRRRIYGPELTTQFGFAIDLANLGSIGMDPMRGGLR
jgi:LPS-assembly protein